MRVVVPESPITLKLLKSIDGSIGCVALAVLLLAATVAGTCRAIHSLTDEVSELKVHTGEMLR